MGELDSFEILPDHAVVPGGPNGVPRSGWQRTKRAARWHRPYAAILVLLDVGAVALSSLIARANLENADVGFKNAPGLFGLISYVFLPAVWLLVLWGHGAYDRRYLGSGTDEFKRVVRASWTVVAIVAFTAFAFKVTVSRGSVGAALVLGLLFVLVFRYIARRGLAFARTKFHLATHRMLLIGTLQEALEVHSAIARDPASGLVPVGIHLTEGYAPRRATVTPVPVHSGRDILSLVRELNADTIAVCGSASAEPVELRRLAWQLEGTGIDLAVAPQLTDIAGPRVHIRPIEGIPLLYVEEPKLSGLGWLFKNVLDRILALLSLLIVLPFFPLIALAIKLSDPGPIFFRQPRIGREGKTFRVWKLRTMYIDAEERLATLKDENESDGLLFKMKNDPRVFRVGRWLRASSVDELPQLINVLMGEMSLVGPRPLPAEDGDFLGDVRRRLLVRPGITGLWQVSGRSDLSWDDAVRLDLYYVDNWSLMMDVHTMWRTIWVVVFRKGADQPHDVRVGANLAAGLIVVVLVCALGGAVYAVIRHRGRRAIATAAQRATYDVLHIAELAAEPLRNGLTEAGAWKAIRHLRTLTGAAGIALTDAKRVLAFDGVGEHHRDHAAAAAVKAVAAGRPTVLGGRELPCDLVDCPIRGAVVVPLAQRAGALVALSDGPPAPGLVQATAETARWVGTQLALAELDTSRARLARAEVRALRAQISPHFIYNALTAIASFVRTDPELARELILEFAEFTRYSFRAHGEFTTLAEELRSIDRYLTIERARFGERLQVRLQIAPEVLPVTLPFLCLQPLVENAVRHGLSRKPGMGTVSIVARDAGAECHITVEDDGVGMDPAALLNADDATDAGQHVGLRNVDDRLRSVFGDGFGVVVETAPDAGTKVSMRVPKFHPGVRTH